MINKKIFILLLFMINSSLQAYCLEMTDSLFKVTRIKSKGDFYIVIAKRNDSLFKIISEKSSLIKSNLELLKRGGYYYFDFDNSNNKNTEEKIEPLSGTVNYLDVKNKSAFIVGETKIRFTKRFHYRLYFTKNLIGLYYFSCPP